MTSRIFPVVMFTLIVSLVGGCSDDPPDPLDPPSDSAFTPTEITIKEVGEGSNLMELVDDKLAFVDAADLEWIAPKGALTDGASVPRLALPVTDGRFEEEFLKAAVLHDAYASDDNRERCPDQYHQRPWKDVHRMFYEACIAGGTSKTKATIMFAAVWLAGPRWDEPASMSLDQVSDEALQAEFKMCKEWIEQNDPTIQEVEAMLDEHALRLLSDEP